MDSLIVRPVRRADLEQVIEIDATVTGLEKRNYRLRLLRRDAIAGDREHRHFLVATTGGQIVGFIIGEVRDWEFGSPPCGWVFANDVTPGARQSGIGTGLLAALSAHFRRAGVSKLRTLLSRDNTLIMSFFRSQGMMAGPLMSLEMDLLTDGAGGNP
ncbi:MAG: GNAT family N-acetyltransferase [Burkholderiales bacterium]|nr:GNAT family N-acetyltransferase [Burkholderiales bacterium]